MLTAFERRKISLTEVRIDLEAALSSAASGDFDKLKHYMQVESFKERLEIDPNINLHRREITWLRDEILDPPWDII